MIFLRRICSSRPGDGEQRRQSLSALTACNWGLDCLQPQPQQPVLRAGRTLCVQTGWATHGVFLARRKLASGSSRAPCAFPNLRCCPRCWLFSCLGVYFHLRILPESTERSAAAIFGRSGGSLLFHGALWNILLSAGFPAMFHMIALEQTFVNDSLQKIFSCWCHF